MRIKSLGLGMDWKEGLAIALYFVLETQFIFVFIFSFPFSLTISLFFSFRSLRRTQRSYVLLVTWAYMVFFLSCLRVLICLTAFNFMTLVRFYCFLRVLCMLAFRK